MGTYLKRLVGAGLDGISSARREFDGSLFAPASQAVVWTPTAIGAAVGMLGTRWIGNRKSPSNVAMGGLVGGAFGAAAAVAWASRGFAGIAARKAVLQVNAVRDAHWLETHPIDYA